MFIKTAISFAVILFLTGTLTARTRLKKVTADLSTQDCFITEFHKKGDVLYAQGTHYRFTEKECEEKAKLECSIFSLRVEYVWKNLQKKTIDCESRDNVRAKN